MTIVHTIGHSTRDFDLVVTMLRSNMVTQLLDVRSFPSSRKFPQWDREYVESSLPPNIGYQWMPQLGGRRYTPVGVPTLNGGWRVKAFRDYADYMSTPAFQAGLDQLIHLADHSSPAIMCSEAVPLRCHRGLIADALLVRGVTVSHIMSTAATRPAELTSFAEVREGSITYPPAESAA